MVLKQSKDTNMNKIEIIKVNEKPNDLDLRRKERDFGIIGNKIRLKVLYKLCENDSLNFNKLAELTKTDKNKLAYHIALLRNANFISNEKKQNKEGKAFSFYSITDKGRKYFNLVSKPSL